MIQTYYLADIWLRVSLVLFAVVVWIYQGARFGTAELVYIGLVILVLVAANQMYKSGNRELLLTAITRDTATSAHDRR